MKVPMPGSSSDCLKYILPATGPTNVAMKILGGVVSCRMMLPQAMRAPPGACTTIERPITPNRPHNCNSGSVSRNEKLPISSGPNLPAKSPASQLRGVDGVHWKYVHVPARNVARTERGVYLY